MNLDMFFPGNHLEVVGVVVVDVAIDVVDYLIAA